MDNNPLTYIFSSTSLDVTGHHWVSKLADHNFLLEYQKAKDNTVADFLSHVDKFLSEAEVEEYLTKSSHPLVKAVFTNTTTPIEERAKVGTELPQVPAQLQKALTTCPARFSTMHVTDWKQVQKEDPVLYAVVKHL